MYILMADYRFIEKTRKVKLFLGLNILWLVNLSAKWKPQNNWGSTKILIFKEQGDMN